MDSFRNLRLGELLKEYGYITDSQLSAALKYQELNSDRRIGEVLIEFGFITEKQMLKALSDRMNLTWAEVEQVALDITAAELVSKSTAIRYQILPVCMKNDILTVLVNDPLNFYGLEEVRQATGCQLEIVLAEKEPLKRAINDCYAEIEAKQAAVRANSSAHEALIITDREAPIISLLDSLLKRAVAARASDIHIEPFEEETHVRMRIDGALLEYVTLFKTLHSSLISRIKIISELDIAERRLPQDGHMKATINEQNTNIRVSIVPTVYGEKAVLRLLDNNSIIDNSGTFGMQQSDYNKFIGLLGAPNGIIYLTGPTGSGKTTTLYMVLEHLRKRNVNISTIEDPVEKNIAGINQMQVNTVADLTFEKGLRALLRQDPDIIMVGETRDNETAAISVRAAITGHLVLSTLHTNDACSLPVRLNDMGVEPYLLSNSLTGVVAQRLLRKVCPNCCEEVVPTDRELELLGIASAGNIRLKKTKGCFKCNNTGYKGRTAVHEILAADSEVKKLIAQRAPTEDIEKYAVTIQGMTTLKSAAARLVLDGVTTFEEYMRVTAGM